MQSRSPNFSKRTFPDRKFWWKNYKSTQLSSERETSVFKTLFVNVLVSIPMYQYFKAGLQCYNLQNCMWQIFHFHCIKLTCRPPGKEVEPDLKCISACVCACVCGCVCVCMCARACVYLSVSLCVGHRLALAGLLSHCPLPCCS